MYLGAISQIAVTRCLFFYPSLCCKFVEFHLLQLYTINLALTPSCVACLYYLKGAEFPASKPVPRFRAKQGCGFYPMKILVAMLCYVLFLRLAIFSVFYFYISSSLLSVWCKLWTLVTIFTGNQWSAFCTSARNILSKHNFDTLLPTLRKNTNSSSQQDLAPSSLYSPFTLLVPCISPPQELHTPYSK